MSITIQSSPADRSSAHEPLWFVVESTNKAGSGFQYIFDIYHDSTLLTRVKNSPVGTGKYGVINVGSIVRSKLATESLSDFDPFDFSNEVSLGADVFFVDYDIRFGEQASGTITANLASGTYRAYNTYTRPGIEGTQSFSSGTVWLTNRPSTSNFYEGEPVVLSVQSLNGVNYERDYDDGNAEEAYGWTGAGGAVFFPVGNRTADFNISINNLDTSGTIGIKYFKKKCSKYTPRTLVFLNCFGAWDSFTFVNGVLMHENEKKKFEVDRWQLSGTSMVKASGRVQNEGWKAYANDVRTKMRLTSDILDTGEYTWLAELVNSPLVYLVDNEVFYPVLITQSNYELKNALQNKAEVLELEIELQPFNTQFR